MRFPIDAVSPGALVFLLLVAVLPLVASGVFVWFREKGRSGLLILLATVVLGAGILGAAWWQMGTMQARISADTVAVEAGFYRLHVARVDLQLAQAQILPCNALGSRMAYRSNGIGLPWLQAGWFTGAGGKVFAAIGTAAQCVVLPTREGPTVILSPAQPTLFLAALQPGAGHTP